MKRISFLFVLWSICLSTLARYYVTFVPNIGDKKTWKVGRFVEYPTITKEIEHYTLEEDTVIGDVQYKKMTCRYHNPMEDRTEYIGAFREENKRVYYVPSDREKEYLLYDFAAEVGDTVEVYDSYKASDVSCIVNSKEEKTYYGYAAIVMTMKERIGDEYVESGREWVEGIGTLGRPWQGFQSYPGDYYGLISCKNYTVCFSEYLYSNIYLIDGTMFSDYHPFIEEEKVWTTGIFPYGDAAENALSLSTYTFEGDTIVWGKHCKRWVKRTQKFYNGDGTSYVDYVLPLYEKDRRVYLFNPGETEPRLFYDFNVSAEKVTLYMPGETCGTSYFHRGIETNGKYRYYYFRSEDVPEEDLAISGLWYMYLNNNCWIEGIGTWLSPDFNSTMDGIGITCTLLECRVGDEILYKNTRWQGNSITAPTHNMLPHSNAFFDLQGRKVVDSGNAKPGIYIKDGRKKLVR